VNEVSRLRRSGCWVHLRQSKDENLGQTLASRVSTSTCHCSQL
jgi:hypothetical protein